MEDNLKRRMVDLALLWDVPTIQSVHILEKLVVKSIKTGFFENLLSGIKPAFARAGFSNDTHIFPNLKTYYRGLTG